MARLRFSVPAFVVPVCLLLAVGSLVIAGGLNPPAGPVAPTMKALDEVEARTAINGFNTPGDADSLYKITQPGSYYLTGNITGVAGKHGIEIIASGVTLDLNGFDLVGIPGMGAFDGVSTTVSGLTNLAVVDGSVRGWGDEGVDLGTLIAINCRVEGVLSSGNTGVGISVGQACLVTNCSGFQNASGIISNFNGSTITNCSVYDNTGIGINVSNGCTVVNCSAYDNTGIGIVVGSGSTVADCAAYSNSGHGIFAGSGGAATNCLAYLNGGSGIFTGTGCAVAGCTVRLNFLDGVLCGLGCTIRGNTCSSNGSGGDGAGIHITGADNRIEGNNCTGGDRGIDVDAAGNFIAGNTCSGNVTNWDVVAGNACLVVSATTSAAIVGNSGGVSPGSTNPNANFTY